MTAQMTFQRYEIKYLLTKQDKEQIQLAMIPYMVPDQHGKTTIRNIYFDTQDYRLIRRSIEKPVYKEKLRIRSYRPAQMEEPIFVEIKKKYKAVVYKRRISISQKQAVDSLRQGAPLPVRSQIAEEINYFRWYYGKLQPTVFLSYERQAFSERGAADLRITFDENILYRKEDFFLGGDIYGTSLLDQDQVLMEIKTTGGIPLWLTHLLTQQHLFKTSFSKYGAAYLHMIGGMKKGRFYYE